MLQKNVATQKWLVYAWDDTADTPVTGDALNITAKISQDHGTRNASDDTNPTELEDGYYLFDLTQGETDGDILTIFPQSSTGNVQVRGVPETLQTTIVAAAKDNLSLMYDGTGYTEPTAPASRTQVDQIVTTGSAVNVGARAAPAGFALTTGSEVNDEDSTQALDGTRHELTDDGGVLDALYKFDILGNGVPVGLQITGVFNGNNDSWGIFANVGTDSTPVWQQVGTINGSNGNSNTVHSFDLLLGQIVSDVVGEVQIRISGTGLTTSSFDVDQIIVSKAVINTLEVYELGQIWINTNVSNENTEPGVDGTAGNPVSTMAAALTLSGLTGITDFHVINGSAIVLGADMSNASFFGDNWTLDLSDEVVTGAYIQGATVSGAGTAASEVHFEGCDFGVVSIQRCHGDKIGFSGTVTHTLASDYDYHGCYSKGDTPPVFAKTSGQAVVVEFIGYEGDITISGLEAGDVVELGGFLREVVLNGADATVHIHGQYNTITDNRTTTGARVLDITGAIKTSDVAAIKVPTDKLVFTKANELDVNMKSINEAEVTGDGDGDPWDGA